MAISTSMRLASMRPRANLAADAAVSLARAIRDGSMKPGARLPSETEIARQLGVSRPVVREAIASLRADGLVESRQGLGLFVNRPETLRLSLAEIEASEQTILEFLEFRLGLEAEAAQLAALRHRPEDLGRIEARLRELEEADDAGEPSAELDLAFHLAIADASHSPVFSKVLRFVAAPLLNSIRGMRAKDAGAAVHVGIRRRDHHAILDGIRARDADAAGSAMREHIGESYRRYAAQMSPSPDPAWHPALAATRRTSAS